MTATTPNPWLSRLAGKTSEEMAAILRYELSYAWFADTSRVCLPAITAAIEAIQALERERAAKVAETLKTLKCWLPTGDKGQGETEHATIHGAEIASSIRALSPAAQGKSGGEW